MLLEQITSVLKKHKVQYYVPPVAQSIENCGRICANECEAIKEVEEIVKSLGDTDSVDIIIEKMNKGFCEGSGNTITF